VGVSRSYGLRGLKPLCSLRAWMAGFGGLIVRLLLLGRQGARLRRREGGPVPWAGCLPFSFVLRALFCWQLSRTRLLRLRFTLPVVVSFGYTTCTVTQRECR
jgi:hypothetical protein